MLKGPLTLASFGLAFNVLLWSVPGLVGASAVPHLVAPDRAPTLARMLAAAERTASVRPSPPDALIQLIGAEAEALQVAGVALQQPLPPDLATQADHAGTRVVDAVTTYVRAAHAPLNREGRSAVR